MSEVIDKVKEFLRNYCDTENFGREIFCDYNDELGDRTIKEILESDDPETKFDDILAEWALNYRVEYGDDELIEKLKEEIGEDIFEEHSEEICEYVFENVYFYYPDEHFNKEVEVNIMVDCGDGNYDFTSNNVLNYCGDGKFGDGSSIEWLAKQQKKCTLLRKAIKEVVQNNPFNDYECKFVESVIQELENASSHMNVLIFLVKMKLFDLFELRKIMNKATTVADKYDTRKSKDVGCIIISRDTMCGLFDAWGGGGSVLAIELDKDVKLPIQYIWSAHVDGMRKWDVGEVYGMCERAWRGRIKEINFKEEAVCI